MVKCAYCSEDKESKYYDCGLEFCCVEHRELYRFKPYMTDETYKEDTTIDTINLDNGKETIEIQTPDSFYTTYSGYKVIVIQYRLFWHKQLCGFRTVNNAQEAWKRFKDKHGYISWADIHKEQLTK